MSALALRQGAEQLMKYCVYYLGTHLKMVTELNGRGCLPPAVQARVSQIELEASLRDSSRVESIQARSVQV